MEPKLFYGRRVLGPRQQTDLPDGIQVTECLELSDKSVHCLRCNARFDKVAVELPNHHYYCPQCILLGRVSTLTRFYHLPEPNQFERVANSLTWSGELSDLQRDCSAKVDQCMTAHQRHLLWAVTGAGKTEMLFAGIASALERGERVAIASPRVDVCIELFPRLQQAFARHTICLLHGRQDEPYQYTQLTICTTHQLLKFYHAFDNLIVDEVDAFPYAENPQLYFATENAIKPNGGLLYLTATPGKKLLADAHKRDMIVSYLPLRYHRHLLPEIRLRLVANWRTGLSKQHLPGSLITAMRRRLQSGRRFLLFVPKIADLPQIKRVLDRQLHVDSVTVYAADEHRIEKVQAMREDKVPFLVTTSILERGVTFPEIDVLVLGADDQVFSTAALVQIAGRAGRSVSRPTGDVLFWIGEYSNSVRNAVKQIKFVNRKGRKILNGLSAVPHQH